MPTTNNSQVYTYRDLTHRASVHTRVSLILVAGTALAKTEVKNSSKLVAAELVKSLYSFVVTTIALRTYPMLVVNILQAHTVSQLL